MSGANPKTLLTHGLHLGHQKNKVHPKSRRYIHSYQRGTSIIDLIQTATLLDEAKKQVSQLAQEGKTLVVVATKKIARQPVSAICQEYGIPYITNKWIAGFLTNFAEISKNIQRMNDARKAEADGLWNELPKHERTQLEKELNKVTSVYGGVSQLEKVPDAVFIIDIKKEANALKEALQIRVPAIAIVDTNVNPEDVTFPIPANDDAITSVEYIMKEIAEAYKGASSKVVTKN